MAWGSRCPWTLLTTAAGDRFSHNIRPCWWSFSVCLHRWGPGEGFLPGAAGHTRDAPQMFAEWSPGASMPWGSRDLPTGVSRLYSSERSDCFVHPGDSTGIPEPSAPAPRLALPSWYPESDHSGRAASLGGDRNRELSVGPVCGRAHFSEFLRLAARVSEAGACQLCPSPVVL